MGTTGETPAVSRSGGHTPVQREASPATAAAVSPDADTDPGVRVAAGLKVGKVTRKAVTRVSSAAPLEPIEAGSATGELSAPPPVALPSRPSGIRSGPAPDRTLELPISRPEEAMRREEESDEDTDSDSSSAEGGEEALVEVGHETPRWFWAALLGGATVLIGLLALIAMVATGKL